MVALSQGITYYYLLGLRHREILAFLQTEEGIDVSMSTLRPGCGSLSAGAVEYKFSHLKCIQSGLMDGSLSPNYEAFSHNWG